MSWQLSFSPLGITVNAGIAFAQLVLLMLGIRAQQREVWLVVLAAVAMLALVAWTAALRRRHAIAGTPTSRVASAAQGRVELRGLGLPLDINPLHSPVSGRACLWYRYQVEHQTSDHKWETVEQDQSHASFVLDDGSGRCLVDPEGAEIVTRHCKRWNDGRYRYVEWTLHQQDAIYVLGNFVTRHPSQGLDAGADVRDLLAEWKQDQSALLRRFDLDHDGRIDDREWALARRLAQGEVGKRHREMRQQPDLHLVHQPPDGPYLISNQAPDRLARRYLCLALAQLAAFLAALGGLGWWWPRVV